VPVRITCSGRAGFGKRGDDDLEYPPRLSVRINGGSTPFGMIGAVPETAT
jgi:hypothetical protein